MWVKHPTREADHTPASEAVFKMCGATDSPNSLQYSREILFHVGVYNTVWRMAVHCFIWVCTNLAGKFRCGCKITLLGEFNFINGCTTVFCKLGTLL